jgi:hypothetical protein
MSQIEPSFATDFLHRRMAWDLSRPRFMDFQRERIQSITAADPTFPAGLRQAALDALGNGHSGTIRRGLIALAFVGTSADIPMIEPFTAHEDSDVTKDAQTCLFEIRHSDRVA